MSRRLTITLDDAVYEGLQRRVGPRRISRFLENLVRPHVIDRGFDEGYQAMAADERREAEAREWTDNLVGDVADEPR